MSVLVFAESIKGKFKKASFEVVCYGRKVADAIGEECIALVLGEAESAGQLGEYGAQKVVQVKGEGLKHFGSQVYANVISQAVEKLGSSVVILGHNSTGKSLLGRLSVRLKAGSVSGATSLPDTSDGFKVTKGVFSSKAFATFDITTPIKLVSLMGNALGVEKLGDAVSVEELNLDVPSSKLEITEVEIKEGIVPLPEAELVVSAGRGMKDPGNWGIIEEMADLIGATLACSRPVADSGWRSHHEHVGQTGIAIRPNLYIAIGISGAIQHLAGVNNSKVIVVINKDPEAPFFKAADYGICADLFDVVPELNKALKEFKSQA